MQNPAGLRLRDGHESALLIEHADAPDGSLVSRRVHKRCSCRNIREILRR